MHAWLCLLACAMCACLACLSSLFMHIFDPFVSHVGLVPYITMLLKEDRLSSSNQVTILTVKSQKGRQNTEGDSYDSFDLGIR